MEHMILHQSIILSCSLRERTVFAFRFCAAWLIIARLAGISCAARSVLLLGFNCQNTRWWGVPPFCPEGLWCVPWIEVWGVPLFYFSVWCRQGGGAEKSRRLSTQHRSSCFWSKQSRFIHQRDPQFEFDSRTGLKIIDEWRRRRQTGRWEEEKRRARWTPRPWRKTPTEDWLIRRHTCNPYRVVL